MFHLVDVDCGSVPEHTHEVSVQRRQAAAHVHHVGAHVAKYWRLKITHADFHPQPWGGFEYRFTSCIMLSLQHTLMVAIHELNFFLQGSQVPCRGG
jgi:hypothetical protein